MRRIRQRLRPRHRRRRERSCYLDEDGDTYAEGAASSSECACRPGPPHGGPRTGPTATTPANRCGRGIEVCDGARLDEDCDGALNPIDLCVCADGDTRACEASGRCSTGPRPAATVVGGSCSISPAIEICNGEDDDCDGSMDEGTQLTCYRDADRDGYPRNDMSPTMACLPGQPDDAQPGRGSHRLQRHEPRHPPGTAEICDAGGVDENCDGSANAGCTCTVPSSRVCPQPGAARRAARAAKAAVGARAPSRYDRGVQRRRRRLRRVHRRRASHSLLRRRRQRHLRGGRRELAAALRVPAG
ncbi:MAG: hypothetical protein H6720_02295 [Sandaracinus sp.]|nr:hypothetical protein [Sandaracinus sp.]